MSSVDDDDVYLMFNSLDEASAWQKNRPFNFPYALRLTTLKLD